MERQLLLKVAISCAGGDGVLARASWMDMRWRMVWREDKISCGERKRLVSGCVLDGDEGCGEVWVEENVDLGDECGDDDELRPGDERDGGVEDIVDEMRSPIDNSVERLPSQPRFWRPPLISTIFASACL